MNSATQDMKLRQSLLKYLQKYGVTKVAIRQYIYRWLRRYDGTLESLREQSRRLPTTSKLSLPFTFTNTITFSCTLFPGSLPRLLSIISGISV